MKKVIYSVVYLSFLIFTNSVHANVINPSFEDGINGWTVTPSGSFGHSISPYSTDGANSYRMWSFTSCANEGCGSFSFDIGDYISLSQSFDMSLINSLTFDTRLDSSGFGSTMFQDFIEAAVYIDSVQVWSSQTHGEYFDINIDTSLLNGVHTLDFRLQSTGLANDIQSDHFYVDNIRVSAVPVPGAVWLFGSGLLGLISVARRLKTRY